MDVGSRGGMGMGMGLAPGFRFHPTDEELVIYYLRRKIHSKPFRFDAISHIDIYKSEPSQLPYMSKLKSRDLEWYFFTVLDNKYSNGAKTNRATEKGYWKTTGKDRPIYQRTQVVGMKKTLVYHSGRAPKGARSNWVMHEYRLVDQELQKAGIRPRDAFVLCRVFQKSGTGPKNGEQYGAPLVEDEWENDELVMVPGEVITGDVAVYDDFGDELEQMLETENPSDDFPVPDSFYYGDEGFQVEQRENFIDDPQKSSIDFSSGCIIPEDCDGPKLFHLPVENDMDTKIVKHEFMGESSNSEHLEYVDYLIDEPILDARINPPVDDGEFVANDLSNPIEDNGFSFDRVEDYFNYFDADEDKSLYGDMNFSKMMGSENLKCGQLPLLEQHVNVRAPEENEESKQALEDQNNDVASTSNHDPSCYDSAKDKNCSDVKYPPFLKQSSCFGSDYPSKGLSLGASHSSGPIHVTAGMVFIRNMSVTGNETYWLPGKNLEVNVFLPFGDSQIYDDGGSLLSKSAYSVSPIWYYLMFLVWVMILPLSFMIGTFFYTGKAL